MQLDGMLVFIKIQWSTKESSHARVQTASLSGHNTNSLIRNLSFHVTDDTLIRHAPDYGIWCIALLNNSG
jgi:hypothetical protein